MTYSEEEYNAILAVCLKGLYFRLFWFWGLLFRSHRVKLRNICDLWF